MNSRSSAEILLSLLSSELEVPKRSRMHSSIIMWKAQQLARNEGSRHMLSWRNSRPVMVSEEVEVSGLEQNQLGKEEKGCLLSEY